VRLERWRGQSGGTWSGQSGGGKGGQAVVASVGGRGDWARERGERQREGRVLDPPLFLC
jgi:hypothetical protein